MSHADVSPITGPESGPRHSFRRNAELHRSLPPLPTSDNHSTIPGSELQTTTIEKHPTVPIWPDEPQGLHRGGWLAALSCMGDVVVIMTSTMFFVYGSLVIYFDGVPVSEIPHLSILQDSSRYGPTIFPILFAAIVGQAMHAIAHWRLENGERMKVLDQLLGSSGLFSTIITQLKFRNMGFVGLALICLWILSPIGGQASLRVLDYNARLDSRTRPIYAMDWDSVFEPADRIPLSEIAPESTEASYSTQLFFGAALSSSLESKISPMDLWGNIKIPMIERLTNSAFYDDGWREVPRKNTTYSSLIGIPWSGVSSETNTTFNMEHSYWTLDCPTLELGYGLIGENGTSKFANGYVGSRSTSWGITMDTDVHGQKNYETDSNSTSIRISYSGTDGGPMDSMPHYTNATCFMKTSYVEVEVFCQRQNCSAIRIRPSIKPHQAPEIAMGMYPWAGIFVEGFHSSFAANMQSPCGFQRYFRHPGSPFTNTWGEDLALHNLTNTQFATSFSQLLNSFWLAGIGVAKLSTGVSTPIDPEQLPPRNMSLGGTFYQPINATESVTVPLLKCSRPWLAALFIATAAMFLAGAFGLVLEFTRKAPDFALNISSLTRDNPYIHLPPGGSTLDSIDRSRLLQDVRIRLGDIRPDDPVGYVAIASCDREGKVLRLKQLDRTRTFS
ncbi:hypothetical protein BCR34DRAFT_554605 [Clohesyomyces aquaticus]|uniref:Uncharacterized protein n=1 Tax=Clohesyomyces aquaticus TaxID=1231657 RepID=A0A1Y2A654_9PLEO|nr:hypothetical protein BCR34DRAFT_554605 [Clohesyomyces aquaticus]